MVQGDADTTGSVSDIPMTGSTYVSVADESRRLAARAQCLEQMRVNRQMRHRLGSIISAIGGCRFELLLRGRCRHRATALQLVQDTPIFTIAPCAILSPVS